MQDDELNLAIEAALREPPEVNVPLGFRERVLAQPRETADPPEFYWLTPAAVALFAAAGMALWWGRGVEALAAAAVVETSAVLVWLWRVWAQE